MDSPRKILLDALQTHGLPWKEVVRLSAGVENSTDQLDLAEWLLNHPKASREEIVTEGNKLIQNRNTAEK